MKYIAYIAVRFSPPTLRPCSVAYEHQGDLCKCAEECLIAAADPLLPPPPPPPPAPLSTPLPVALVVAEVEAADKVAAPVLEGGLLVLFVALVIVVVAAEEDDEIATFIDIPVPVMRRC
jgi:hypothetical protein